MPSRGHWIASPTSWMTRRTGWLFGLWQPTIQSYFYHRGGAFRRTKGRLRLFPRWWVPRKAAGYTFHREEAPRYSWRVAAGSHRPWPVPTSKNTDFFTFHLTFHVLRSAGLSLLGLLSAPRALFLCAF